MLEKSEDRRSQSHGRDGLPYNPQDWNRRLAEARARRAATLRHRGTRRTTAATPSERLAAAWDSDRDGLTVVTQPIGAPLVAASEPAMSDINPQPGADTIPAASWRTPAVTLLAGCLIGSALTGLIFLGSSTAWQSDPTLPNASALLATAPAEVPAEPSPTRNADTVSPQWPETPARTAHAPAAPDDSAPPPATAAAAPPEWTPAAGPARPLAAPDQVNAPQVQFAALQDVLPAAPASIGRVVVLAPSSVSKAGRNEVAALLREAGWPARDPATSPFTISSTHVRYYHSGDRAGAEELAALLSAEARDFTGYSPRPPNGTVELWLSGRAPARRSAPNRPGLPAFLSRLAAVLEGRG